MAEMAAMASFCQVFFADSVNSSIYFHFVLFAVVWFLPCFMNLTLFSRNSIICFVSIPKKKISLETLAFRES
jgi:hypothetical protein